MQQVVFGYHTDAQSRAMFCKVTSCFENRFGVRNGGSILHSPLRHTRTRRRAELGRITSVRDNYGFTCTFCR